MSQPETSSDDKTRFPELLKERGRSDISPHPIESVGPTFLTDNSIHVTGSLTQRELGRWFQQRRLERSFTVGLPDVNPPPENHYLARSAWPQTHRTGYAQGSSGNPVFGLDEVSTIGLANDFLKNPLVLSDPITLFYSEDGKFLWGSSWTCVFKVERNEDTLKLAGYKTRPIEGILTDIFHGAYSLLTYQNVFFTSAGKFIEAYYDGPQGGVVQHQYVLAMPVRPPKSILEQEAIRAMCLTWDNKIVFASNFGFVGVASAQIATGNGTSDEAANFDKGIIESLDLSTNGDVAISNNIACDEEGGVYIVSDRFMHKLQWDSVSNTLTTVWQTPYGTPENSTSIGRVGTGSGSTPTIMGSGDRKYIVITDAAIVMNIILFDAKTGDSVASAPVTFGDPNVLRTLSEQSVLVYGWRMVVVNNTPFQGSTKLMQHSPPTVKAILSNQLLQSLAAGTRIENAAHSWNVLIGDAPRGVEQFEFNVTSGTLRTTWVNRKVSLPNCVPTMTWFDGILFGIGKRADHGSSPHRISDIGHWKGLIGGQGSLLSHSRLDPRFYSTRCTPQHKSASERLCQERWGESSEFVSSSLGNDQLVACLWDVDKSHRNTQ